MTAHSLKKPFFASQISKRGATNAFLGRDDEGLIPEGLITVKQVHGNVVIDIDGSSAEVFSTISADALITANKEIAIGIRTADCLPILLFDVRSRAVGAVHAGWRGTVKGVVESTIKLMQKKYKSDPNDILAAFGPAIGPCCYEVGPELKEEFINASLGERAFTLTGNSLKLDLKKANIEQLLNTGLKIENISTEAPCTICSNDRYYSHRLEKEKAGRQISFIVREERQQA